MKTLRVFSANRCHVKQENLACGNARQSRKSLGSRMMMSARLASHKGMISLRELQSATGEELLFLKNNKCSIETVPGFC